MKFRMLAWAVAALAVPVTAAAQQPGARPVSYREIAAAYESQSAEIEQLRMRLASLEEEVLTPVPEAVYVEDGYHGMPGGCGPACDEACCCPCPLFYAGGEMVWLKPHFSSANAFAVEQTSTLGNSVVTNTPFDYDYEISPRVWFGYRSACGTGWRARYWLYDHEVATADFADVTGGTPSVTLRLPNTLAVIPLPLSTAGGLLETAHRLDLETIDLEATHDLTVGCTVLRISGGVRYMDMSQEYQALSADAFPSCTQVDYEQHFEGFGPTIALEVGHQLWCCFSIYAHARGSVLFGHRSSRLEALWANPDVETRIADYPRGDDVLSIGELGLGLEANFGTIFARAGYEGQIWWGAGGPTDSTSDLGLHGFHITSGVMF